MGASNFHYENASKCFAMGVDNNEEDGYDIADYELDILSDTIMDKAAEAGYGSSPLPTFDPHALRSYPTYDIAMVYSQKLLCGVWLEVNVSCVARVGYYQGACLDWHSTAEAGGDVVYEDGEVVHDIMSAFEDALGRKALAKMAAYSASVWIEKKHKELVNFVESIFEQHSTPLRVLGSFSNGETIYSK